jgi:glyoxylase-like metal-dependent hydrolase (beta-lactamase superfamily II)
VYKGGHPLAEHHCTLIEIKQEMPGFDRFIGSWVYQDDINFVVDVGPANSVGYLIQALSEMGVTRLDYVLLTHIHVDHAGGLGKLLEHFPMARVVCHEKGIRHLVDPSRLWEGTQMVLKEIAESYGPYTPVVEKTFIPHTQAEIENLTIVETPGHAPHHLSFSYQGNLFAGEAAGNYYAFGKTDYLRPATPPKFFFDVFLGSIDRLTALGAQHICYAHFGDAPDSRQMLERFRNQVFRWKEIIEEEISGSAQDMTARCMDRLLQDDPDLKAFELMDTDMQNRERFFMANSVRGDTEFLKNTG